MHDDIKDHILINATTMDLVVIERPHIRMSMLYIIICCSRSHGHRKVHIFVHAITIHLMVVEKTLAILVQAITMF